MIPWNGTTGALPLKKLSLLPWKLEFYFLVGILDSNSEKVVEKVGISYPQLKTIEYGDRKVKDWILKYKSDS